MAKEQNPAVDLISLSDFRTFMYDNIVPIERLVDHKGAPLGKMLPFWRRHRLIPFIDKHKMLRLSFAQLIWLRILDTLRVFGFPISKTEAIADYFFKDAYTADLPKQNMEENQKLLLKKKTAGTISEEEERTLLFVENSLNNPVMLYGLKFDINYLTVLLTHAILDQEEYGIMIFDEGRVGESRPGGIVQTHGKYSVSSTEPHLYISVTSLLREFISNEELSQLFIPQLLNEDEKRVLREMRIKNVKEIKVKLHNGRMERIETEKSGTLTAEEAQKIREILALKNYEQITLDTRDEKTIIFKRIKKIIK